MSKVTLNNFCEPCMHLIGFLSAVRQAGFGLLGFKGTPKFNNGDLYNTRRELFSLSAASLKVPIPSLQSEDIYTKWP